MWRYLPIFPIWYLWSDAGPTVHQYNSSKFTSGKADYRYNQIKLDWVFKYEICIYIPENLWMLGNKQHKYLLGFDHRAAQCAVVWKQGLQQNTETANILLVISFLVGTICTSWPQNICIWSLSQFLFGLQPKTSLCSPAWPVDHSRKDLTDTITTWETQAAELNPIQ